MPPTHRRNRWLLVRIAIYVSVLLALVFFRGDLNLQRLLPKAPDTDPATLSISGFDLAPELMDYVVSIYRRGRGPLDVQTERGGTARALEAILDHRSDVALLSRPPTAEEQSLFTSVSGDSVAWFPVALGAILVLRGAEPDPRVVSLEDLRALALGHAVDGAERLYVPDPNRGLWQALCHRLDIEASIPADTGGGGRIVFLADAEAVLLAVERDPSSLGVVSSLELSPEAMAASIHPVDLGEGTARVGASRESIAEGTYPLFHHLYIACRADVSPEGSMFVTHLTSGRGQRSVERAGFLPAKQVLREVFLTRNPVNES